METIPSCDSGHLTDPLLRYSIEVVECPLILIILLLFFSFEQRAHIDVRRSNLSLTEHAAINFSRSTLRVKVCKWDGDKSIGVRDWLRRDACCVQVNVEIIDFEAGLNPSTIAYSSPDGREARIDTVVK